MAQNSSRKKAPARKSSLMGLLLGGRKATGAEAKAREEKAREEKARRTSKARNSAKRQLDYIGYDAMYKNGIAQVEEGLFSQTSSSPTSATNRREGTPRRTSSPSSRASTTTSTRTARCSSRSPTRPSPPT